MSATMSPAPPSPGSNPARRRASRRSAPRARGSSATSSPATLSDAGGRRLERAQRSTLHDVVDVDRVHARPPSALSVIGRPSRTARDEARDHAGCAGPGRTARRGAGRSSEVPSVRPDEALRRDLRRRVEVARRPARHSSTSGAIAEAVDGAGRREDEAPRAARGARARAGAALLAALTAKSVGGAVRERHVRLREMDDRVDLGKRAASRAGEVDLERLDVRRGGDPRRSWPERDDVVPAAREPGSGATRRSRSRR